MNYGEQRFRENMRELTPEEKAKQFLAIEALKEQTRYERKKRQKLAKKVKEGVGLFTKFVIIVLLGIVLATVVGCTPEPSQECITFDLGKAGETYEPLSVKGLPGVIYVEGDRIKQDICTF